MLVYLTIIFGIYFIFLLVCFYGWMIFSKSRVNTPTLNEFVTVVVAARNEAYAISPLLNSLARQQYPRDKFEIIFVDDHSTDDTRKVIDRWRNDNPDINTQCLSSSGIGKKLALTEGIQQATGEWILTTDADCVVSPDWIETMARSFLSTTSMIVGLVKIEQEQSLFSKLQSMEFSSLTGSSISLLACGFPIMCNGANLAFRKSKFEAVQGYKGNLHIPSGDDEFLMRKFNKKFPGSISAVSGSCQPVSSKPQPDIKSFIHQRLRWAGKWKVNDSMITRVLALFILIFQITYIIALAFLLIGSHTTLSAGFIGTKIVLEATFIFWVSRRLHNPFSLSAFLILQVTYPVYVIMIGVLAQLLDYEWKARTKNAVG